MKANGLMLKCCIPSATFRFISKISHSDKKKCLQYKYCYGVLCLVIVQNVIPLNIIVTSLTYNYLLYSLSRKENGEVKKHVQDQDDIILGLRRDLAGASARLSDITGI